MRYALGIVCFCLSGCFFYDSSWGQQKRAQQHFAAHETPKQLGAQSSRSATRVAERALRLRVYATPDYAATVVNWQKQFASLLTCANSVFVADFGASFEITEARTFKPQANEEKLSNLLQELGTEDDGKGVEWVIGLASAVPRFAVSADDLGLAPVLGNQLVMRAMSDPQEYEAIEQGLDELSEDARRKLYQERKRHKLCTVFLHEIAHTLGVPHELLASSLMNSHYNVEARGFSDEAAEIIRASLRVRGARPSTVVDASLARDLTALLSVPNAGFEPKSRAALLRQLASSSGNAIAEDATQDPPAQSQSQASPSEPVPSARAPTIAGLNADQQHRYDRARAELDAGHALVAREIAATLLKEQPALPALQDLRCEIAMGVGGDFQTISSECPGLSPFGSAK